MRQRIWVTICLAVLLVPFLFSASQPPAAPGPLSAKEFMKQELVANPEIVSLPEVRHRLRNESAWTRYLADESTKVSGFIDARSGTAASILTSRPLVPGSGVKNTLTLPALAKSLGHPVKEMSEELVAEVVKRYIVKNSDVLGIDIGQLGTFKAAAVTDDLWQVSAPQVSEGVPVRSARIGATLSHGNLVLLGTSAWGNVVEDPSPTLAVEDAVRIAFDYAGGRLPQDSILVVPTLEFVRWAPPELATPASTSGPVGSGYAHRLVWTFQFERRGEIGIWEALVDAKSGEVLSFRDVVYSAQGTIKGGVYPQTSTEACPTGGRCGTMQSYPMPWADTGLASPNNYSNAVGTFSYTSGSITTTLTGKYFSVTAPGCDQDDPEVPPVGAVYESGPGPALDLGGSTGNHNCDSTSSSGNIAGSRTSYYAANKIADVARGWLPGNSWLVGTGGPFPIVAHKEGVQQVGGLRKDPPACNASYAPGSHIEFFAGKMTGGQWDCRPAAEIAGIVDHEWGHALDDYDSIGAMSIPSEAYADIAAMYREGDSCIGYGFRGLGAQSYSCDPDTTSDGTGLNGTLENAPGAQPHCLTDCSGVRDGDYLKHFDEEPDTPQNFVCSSCATGGIGPLGREAHCAAAPVDQAAWDLMARDLRWPPFNYDANTASVIANRLFYQGSGSIGAWYTGTCPTPTRSGCNWDSGYLQWLAADDDSGGISDGTPHLTALYNAFHRHEIACEPEDGGPTVQNSGCTGAPSATPQLTVIAGAGQASLSWVSVPGASKYWVFRSEGQAACTTAGALIASPTTTLYTDTQLAEGRRYSYTVLPVGSSDRCNGPSSACRCASVYSGTPPADVLAASDYGIGPGIISLGSYLDTQASDNVNERLTEQPWGDLGISQLWKTWKFTSVPDGCLSFNFEGNRTSSDGDNFQFYWAPDVGGSPGTFQIIPGALINTGFEPVGGITVSFTGPAAGSTIYIGIADTNHLSGTVNDTVKIDRIAILPR